MKPVLQHLAPACSGNPIPGDKTAFDTVEAHSKEQFVQMLEGTRWAGVQRLVECLPFFGNEPGSNLSPAIGSPTGASVITE